jgi:hypothetical protein
MPLEMVPAGCETDESTHAARPTPVRAATATTYARMATATVARVTA